MTARTHTEGPWAYDGRRDASGSPMVMAQHRGPGSFYCVATVNFWEAPEENARLIAAAPCLLAELKLAREWLLTLQTGRRIEAKEALAPRLAAIDAVIAKVEGGAS